MVLSFSARCCHVLSLTMFYAAVPGVMSHHLHLGVIHFFFFLCVLE
jgi:hypothetical protein